MKTLLCFVFAVSCCAISTATAQIDTTFSISSTNATAGSVLEVADGGSGSLFVWVDNADISGLGINGFALDITGAGASALVATAFNTENPELFAPGSGVFRWGLGFGSGTLGVSPGVLVENASAGVFTSPAGGILNGVGPVLYGELQFTATGAGSNTLTLSEGSGFITLGTTAPTNPTFGTATVNVTNAIPEPSSLFLVGSIVGGAFLRRRRRA